MSRTRAEFLPASNQRAEFSLQVNKTECGRDKDGHDRIGDSSRGVNNINKSASHSLLTTIITHH